ncbi:transcriptional regulator [Bacteroidia bacterium]|nr:transcriptional regulator [Bacteroidia bacterium]
METTIPYNVHHGRNIRRLREILNIKQDTIAAELNISQQAMSKLEQKEMIDDEVLERISNVLGISANAIKKFNDEAAINVIANTFNDSSSLIGYNQTFNPIEKVTELYERLLKLEQEKTAWLEKLLKEK